MATYVRPWTTKEQVTAHRQCPASVTDTEVERAIVLATHVLFAATGEMYAGTHQVSGWRPTRLDMSRAGCLIFPAKVRPVVSVQSVVIDGDEIDESRYELRGARLYPVEGSGGRAVFPMSQDLAVADGSAGTWSVDFTYGLAPGPAGVGAATEYAVQTLLGQESDVSPAVQRLMREGVDMTKFDPVKMLEAGMFTGIQVCDDFIRSVNPSGARSRPSIINPDKVRLL